MRIFSAIIVLNQVLMFVSEVNALCFPFYGDSFCVYANDLVNQVKFRFDAPATVGYVAFGPGLSMKDGDIVVAWPNKDNTVTVSRRQVVKFSLPLYSQTNVVTLLQNESGVQSILGRSRMIATFVRDKSPLTGVSFQYALSTNKTSFIWAGHPTVNPNVNDPAAPFSKHPGKTVGTIKQVNILDPSNSFNGTTNPYTPGQKEAIDTFLLIHILSMVLSFAVLGPIAIFIARFFKDKVGAKWVQIHSGLFITVFTGAVAGMIFVYLYIEDESRPHFPMDDAKLATHTLGGITLISIIFLQVVFGHIIEALFKMNRLGNPIWNTLHMLIGGFLWIFGALVIIPIGFSVFGQFEDETWGKNWMIIYFVFIAVIIGCFVWFEVKIGQVPRSKVNAPREVSPSEE